MSDPALSATSTLSLHDALPISAPKTPKPPPVSRRLRLYHPWADATLHPVLEWGISVRPTSSASRSTWSRSRSEEHTSELQSPCNLVCRLLLEKKNKISRSHLTI